MLRPKYAIRVSCNRVKNAHFLCVRGKNEFKNPIQSPSIDMNETRKSAANKHEIRSSIIDVHETTKSEANKKKRIWSCLIDLRKTRRLKAHKNQTHRNFIVVREIRKSAAYKWKRLLVTTRVECPIEERSVCSCVFHCLNKIIYLPHRRKFFDIGNITVFY